MATLEYLDLIKMIDFPIQEDVVEGESWFVITGPDGVGRRISEARLKYFLTTSTGGFIGSADTTVDPNEDVGPQYYFAAESGTYTNFGGLVVDLATGLNILSYDGATWSKVVIPINMTAYVLKEELGATELEVTHESAVPSVVVGSVWRTDNGETLDLSGTYPSSQRSTEIIPVMPGSTYVYTGQAGATSGIAGYDVNGVYNSRILDSSSSSLYPSVTDHAGTVVTIPTGVYFVGASSRTASFDFYQRDVDTLHDFISYLLNKSRVSVGSEVIDIVVPLSFETVNEGSVWRTDTGALADLSGAGYPTAHRSKELLAVSPGEVYRYTGNAGATSGISGFDASKVHNSRILDSSSSSLYPLVNVHVNTVVTIPAGVYFIGVSSRSTPIELSRMDSDTLEDYLIDLSQKTNFDLGLYATKEELDTVQASVDNVLTDSKNLFDKSQAAYGYWNTTGGFQTSSSTVSTAQIPIDPSEGSISMNGWGYALGVTQKVVFWTPDGTFISYVPKTDASGGVNIPIPPTAGLVAVNITSVTGGVGDATDNPYVNTLQIEYGPVTTTYETYGKKVTESALPADLGIRKGILVEITSADAFTVNSRHDNGETVAHKWVRINKGPQYDVGWYATSIIHKENDIVQGSFNWIHMTAFPNEAEHVGHGHGCETDTRARFFVDGTEFVPADEIGTTIEGDIFTFDTASEIYAADEATTDTSWDGSNVVPQLPLVLSTKHFMNGEIRGNSKMRNYNKLVIYRANTQFINCYIAMHRTWPTFWDRIQVHNVENTVNDIQTLTPIAPSTASINAATYDTVEGFRGELAWSATSYSDRYGYIFHTRALVPDANRAKMTIQGAGSSKLYFHPVITTTLATQRGLVADTFGVGDVIEGVVERELIIGKHL